MNLAEIATLKLETGKWRRKEDMRFMMEEEDREVLRRENRRLKKLIDRYIGYVEIINKIRKVKVVAKDLGYKAMAESEETEEDEEIEFEEGDHLCDEEIEVEEGTT